MHSPPAIFHVYLRYGYLDVQASQRLGTRKLEASIGYRNKGLEFYRKTLDVREKHPHPSPLTLEAHLRPSREREPILINFL